LGLRAQALLKKVGMGKHYNSKMRYVVEEMVRAADAGELAEPFEEAKKHLHVWRDAQAEENKQRNLIGDGNSKIAGQLPSRQTLYKHVEELEAIYQILLKRRRS
jgi:hypothetical protein